MRLLVHHHTLAYVDEDGIWVQSFIGAWINELAKNVDKIGLLVYVTEIKEKKLDYCISDERVVIESLGENKGWKNRLSRLAYIRNKCRSLTDYSHLLVRGITPRQLLIINSVNVSKKYFLFVGCLEDAKGVELKNINITNIISYLLKRRRINELRIISEKTKVATNSPTTVKELKDRFNISSTFIPTNTISVNDFIKSSSKKEEKQLRILFVGRVTADKGVDELIKAVIELNKKNGNSFILDIVGPYNDSYLDELKRKNSCGFDCVYFHGFVEFGKSLLEYYDNSDAFVLPSYHEGFPHAIWEAAARRLPIICTPVGGITGIVNDSMVTFIDKKSVSSIVLALENVVLNKNQEIIQKIELIWELAEENSVEPSAIKMINWMKK